MPSPLFACLRTRPMQEHQTIGTTERLVLRQPLASDAGAISALASNPQIANQTASMPYPFEEDQVAAWIARRRTAVPAVNGDALVLLDRLTDDAIVGIAGHGPVEDNVVEINYWIGEPCWGRGLATEAANAVIAQAFGTLEIGALRGQTRVENIGSQRVLEKCGFERVGETRVHIASLDQSVSAHDFILRRRHWDRLKGHLS